MTLFSAWQWWLLDHSLHLRASSLPWSLGSAAVHTGHESCLFNFSAPLGYTERMLQPDGSVFPDLQWALGYICGICLCSSHFPPPLFTPSHPRSDISMCGTPSLNYSSFTYCKIKGRDPGYLSCHQASPNQCLWVLLHLPTNLLASLSLISSKTLSPWTCSLFAFLS